MESMGCMVNVGNKSVEQRSTTCVIYPWQAAWNKQVLISTPVLIFDYMYCVVGCSALGIIQGDGDLTLIRYMGQYSTEYELPRHYDFS